MKIQIMLFILSIIFHISSSSSSLISTKLKTTLKCGECPCTLNNPYTLLRPPLPPPPPMQYYCSPPPPPLPPPPPRFVYVAAAPPPPPPRFVYTTDQNYFPRVGNYLYPSEPLDMEIYSAATVCEIEIKVALLLFPVVMIVFLGF
ncbi:extensin-3-like [Andrographis paniculata]|uniref:extensin-3-like n=1 Tax=Andrographis paniculata TaxID=175694 RepID=UPI0021E78A7F|nr:extensin-3-like [Andrographis paniculata]